MQEKSTIKQNILQFLDNKGISKYEFYKITGITRGILDQNNGMSEDNTAKFLAHFPEVSPEWLLTGTGNMLKTSSISQIASDPSVMNVKLVGQYAYAGYLSGYSDNEYLESLPSIPFVIPEGKTARGQYLAFEVRGDSMDDGSTSSILETDIVLGRLLQHHFYENSKLHYKKWFFVIVHETDGILVKQITDHDVENKTITIHSLNPMYPDRVMHLSEVKLLFNVVQMLRKSQPTG